MSYRINWSVWLKRHRRSCSKLYCFIKVKRVTIYASPVAIWAPTVTPLTLSRPAYVECVIVIWAALFPLLPAHSGLCSESERNNPFKTRSFAPAPPAAVIFDRSPRCLDAVLGSAPPCTQTGEPAEYRKQTQLVWDMRQHFLHPL